MLDHLVNWVSPVVKKSLAHASYSSGESAFRRVQGDSMLFFHDTTCILKKKKFSALLSMNQISSDIETFNLKILTKYEVVFFFSYRKKNIKYV